MFRLSRLVHIIVCISICLSPLYAVEVSTQGTPPKNNSGEILAEYKGGVVTRGDIDLKVSKLPPQSQGRYKTIEGQAQILDMIVVEEIFLLKAKEMNTLNDPAVQERISAAKKQFFTQEYYKRNISEKVVLTEADKQVYYNANKKSFYIDPYISIQYIQPEDEAKANKALKDLKAGIAFEKVSEQYSINTYAKNIGGKIKNIRLNGYIPGVGNDAALDSLIAGVAADTSVVLGPIKTATGWHILKVVERVEGRQRPYLEVEAEVDQRLRPVREKDLLNELVERLKVVYKVVVDTTTLNLVNLREPEKNTLLLHKMAVTAADSSLVLSVKTLLDKYQKLSPQEQVMYMKGGAAQMANQELTRNLMHLDAQREPLYEQLITKNEEFKQTERYFILQKAYKQLVADKVEITTQDALTYYNSHLDSYTTPASRKIEVVWCKNESAAKKVLKQYEKALKKKNSVKLIDDLVKKHSLYPEKTILENQYRNGVVTNVGPDQNFSDMIWATPVGKTSPVFKTAKKDVVFFRVLDEYPPVVKAFNEVEGRIRGIVKREKEKTKMEEVKEQLFLDYNLKKYPERLVIRLTAEELFDLADNSARQRKYKDAILYYDQIIQFYPNGSDDYKASFMKAFLISEEMGNKDQALLLFKAFLQKYPEGELNDSAQFMIDELEGRHAELEEESQD